VYVPGITANKAMVSVKFMYEDSSINIATALRVRRQGSSGSIPDRSNVCFSFHRALTDCATYSASYTIPTGDLLPCDREAGA
jgi:hypothetical protein